MEMYFKDFTTLISTIMVCLAIAFIVFSSIKHKKIDYWGRRVALLSVFGLLLCCFVATRDNYHMSVQYTFDKSVEAGLFAVNSIQAILCYIGGAIIAFTSISSIFIKSQKYRKTMFFVLSAAIIIKASIIEISRWLV